VAGLQELDQQMQQRLKVGSCAPYKGMAVPRPGSG
jgi:hypothetical protein